MGYNYIPKYIRQSENKSPKSVVTASRWNELFNLLIKQGDHTAEELGKILDYLSTGLEDLTNEKLDKTGGVITGNLGVTGKLNIGTTVAITETNNNLLQLAGDYDAPVTIRNVDTPVADNDAATKKYVDDHAVGAGTSDHSQLTNRDAANQHPITAITGLQTALDGKADAADIPSLEGYATEAYVQNYHDNTKQDIITDLVTIRSGASKGSTAVQPESGKGLFSGSYNDLTDKPAIPDAVTEGTVSGWGFTKNTGTYSKPTDGIPKSDLAAAVQTSLGKADSALQKVPIGYRTAAAQDAIDRGKQDKLIAGENITIASDGKTISATGGGAGTMFVTITESNGTLSADKSYNDIVNAIIDGIPVLVDYGDMDLPLIALTAGALYFGIFQCDSGDASNSAVVITTMIEITLNSEVNDMSAAVAALPNPNAITFTGAVTGSYDGSAAMTVNIPSAVTDAHINSLIDTKLGVIENGSY